MKMGQGTWDTGQNMGAECEVRSAMILTVCAILAVLLPLVGCSGLKLPTITAVSYTHLTLPTNREV